MKYTQVQLFLISDFRRVVTVVNFLLGDATESELYVPTFRDSLPVPSSAHKIQVPVYHLKERIQQL
jgi:hypothetical protein